MLDHWWLNSSGSLLGNSNFGLQVKEFCSRLMKFLKTQNWSFHATNIYFFTGLGGWLIRYAFCCCFLLMEVSLWYIGLKVLTQFWYLGCDNFNASVVTILIPRLWHSALVLAELCCVAPQSTGCRWSRYSRWKPRSWQYWKVGSWDKIWSKCW